MEVRRTGPRWNQRQEAVRLGARHAGGEQCAWPGCVCAGCYRAPASRAQLRDYIWLCLDHVRDYNSGWDYFAGMSVDEIDAHRRADTVWHRPSWAFGAWRATMDGRFSDPFGLGGQDERGNGFAGRTTGGEKHRPGGRLGEMIAVLGLDFGFTLEELKCAYKSLAKRYHPDLNGGDRDAEEALKRVIEAYTYLRDNRLYA